MTPALKEKPISPTFAKNCLLKFSKTLRPHMYYSLRKTGTYRVKAFLNSQYNFKEVGLVYCVCDRPELCSHHVDITGS